MKRNNIRIPRMALSVNELSFIHNKNPWMPMWWSAALPGLGHLCEGSYFIGLFLMSWEILINFKANLNLSIFYTLTGQFEKAKETLDISWALFYGVVFSFAIYDAYRRSVEINKLVRIERKQSERKYNFMRMSGHGINYLSQCRPWVAAAWSALLTGFGHVYNKKTFKALILLGWTVAIIAFSNLNKAIIVTFNGQFQKATELVDYQWLLFFPSIYLFAMWDAYNDSVEINKLFDEEQKAYLKKKYYNSK